MTHTQGPWEYEIDKIACDDMAYAHVRGSDVRILPPWKAQDWETQLIGCRVFCSIEFPNFVVGRIFR